MDAETDQVGVTHRFYGLGKKRLTILIASLALIVILAVVVVVTVSAHSAELYPVKMNGKYGFMDKSGNVVIQPQFEQASLFSEGFAPVRTGQRWGYVDRHGNMAIAPQFDMADPFSDG